jgi:hypothetical protein
LAEGATGPFFDCFVLVANPWDQEAAIEVEYWLPDGRQVRKHYAVGPWSRYTIWVDQEDPLLVDTAVAGRLVSVNGVPVVVERAMWWPGPTAASWTEAHTSAGSREAGTFWVSSDGVVDTRRGIETYVLIANVSDRAGRVRVRARFDDGSSAVRKYAILPRSRLNVALAVEMPESADRHFSVSVESEGTVEGAAPPLLVVERSTYWDGPGAGGMRQTWAGGANVLATRVR